METSGAGRAGVVGRLEQYAEKGSLNLPGLWEGSTKEVGLKALGALFMVAS